jgi:hypothetical protein
MAGRCKDSAGPHQEGEEPKLMMNGHEKSDPAIVAVKPTNVTEQSAAELVEPRAGAKGTRDSKACAGLRTGEACPRRWSVCGKLQSEA